MGFSIFEADIDVRDTIDLADNNMYKNKKTKEIHNGRRNGVIP